ncbi:MAG: hypothetical protein RI988_3146 [Pseudomonadota bacterium]
MRIPTGMRQVWLRAGVGTLLVLAALVGLAAGFSFGLQAGGGYVLAIVAGLCFGAFCTLMVDAWVDSWLHRLSWPRHPR